MLTGFPRTRWPRLRVSESYAVRISVKISRICEFRVIMGIMTGLLGCCSSSTLGSRANDDVKTLATLGFWLHHSPCSLGCWTNNTLAARSLSPNENAWIPIKISLKCAPQGPINNIPALDQILAWRRPGDKPLSGPMMVRLPTHICFTQPQWVKNTIANTTLDDCLMLSNRQSFIEIYEYCPFHWIIHKAERLSSIGNCNKVLYSTHPRIT